MTLLQQLHNPQIQRKYFVFSSIGISVTLVWWPLLNFIISASLFFFWLFFCKKKFSFSNRDSKLLLLFCSIYLFVLLGFFNSSNTEEAFFKIQQKSAIALFPVIFGTTSLLTKEDVDKIINWFSLTTLCLCLLFIGNGLAYYLQTGDAQKLHGYEINFLKNSPPIAIATFCIFTFIRYLFASGQTDDHPKKRKFLIYAALVLFCLFFLILFSNRLTLLIGLTFLVFFAFNKLPSLITRVLFLAVFSILLFTVIFINPSLKKQIAELTDFSSHSVIELDKDNSLGRSWGGKSLRLAIWSCSLGPIKENWVTGVGTGDIQDELQTAYEKRKFYFASRYNKYNVHNQYLQQLLANGIGGFLTLLLCIILPFFLFWPQKREYQLYFSFLAVFGIICFTESLLEINKGIVWYSFFNSIFVFSKKNTTK
jgi:O-antigen ligase